MIVVREPAAQFLNWHRQDLVRELAELFRERIDGEEVGTLAAVNQFFSSSVCGAASARMKLATRAMMFESAL